MGGGGLIPVSGLCIFLVIQKNGLLRKKRLISKIFDVATWKTNNLEYTKCGGETIPRPFSKKSKLSIDQQFKALCSLILLCVEGYQTILKSRCRALAFISYKAFFKKTRCGTTIPASYSVLCLKKNIYLATFYYLTKLYCLAAFTS